MLVQTSCIAFKKLDFEERFALSSLTKEYIYGDGPRSQVSSFAQETWLFEQIFKISCTLDCLGYLIDVTSWCVYKLCFTSHIIAIKLFQLRIFSVIILLTTSDHIRFFLLLRDNKFSLASDKLLEIFDSQECGGHRALYCLLGMKISSGETYSFRDVHDSP